MNKSLLDGVSVVIPTHDRPDYLKRLLKTIILQTKPVDEVIIVNDHSSAEYQKEYAEIVNEFSGHLNIKYFVTDKNHGAPYCRNYGILNCTYKYIALTDDDDEWIKDKTDKEYALFKQNRDLGLVYTTGYAVDDDNNLVYRFIGSQEGHTLKAILKECFIPSSSVMVTYDAISAAGLFDEKMPSCQDWDMWTRIIKKGFTYDKVDADLLIYHKHSGVRIGNSKKARRGYTRYYRKHLWAFVSNFLFTKEIGVCLHAIRKAIY